ncbi:MAG: hypothetical protein ALAOOOJD_03877 [bacterium]|nr:hypothetical protein [bacterium]
MAPTRLALLVLFSSAINLGCRTSENGKNSMSALQQLVSPAVSESQAPNLFAAADGKIYLSWIETLAENRHALKFSTMEKNGWSKAKMIAQGDNWFVNWADFPSLRVLTDGTLVAHWLARSGAEKYAYDVNIAFSSDDGNSWGTPIVPHADGTPTEHGFVSLLPWEKDRVLAVWLDGRDHWYKRQNDAEESAEHGLTSLRSAIVDMSGNLYNEAELDDRVCDCCQTGAGITPAGAIVAYRNRSENENRDIAIVRFENGQWSKSETLFNDGWEINGCPVNGPSVATHGSEVAIAWYTEANDTSKVKVSFSRDGGKTFGEPLRVDDGDPMGRVSVILLANNDAVVCWMETIDANAEVRIRRIRPSGSAGQSITVTPTNATRASGFPRMVHNDNELVFAWTKLSDEQNVHTAKMQVRAVQ